MKNKRGKYTKCRLHGGASTGPRTAEGLEHSRKARLVHGLYTTESIAERARVRALVRDLRELTQIANGFLEMVRPANLTRRCRMMATW